jgi:hypothetical protein
MGMIPWSSIGICSEWIPADLLILCLVSWEENSRETWSRSNGALSDTWNSIHPWGIFLEEAMPMKTRSFLWPSDIIVNGDCYVSTWMIPPISLNRRTRILPIYQDSRFSNTIRRYRRATNCEIIVASYTSMWRILRVVVLRVFVSPRKATWKWLSALAPMSNP